MYKYLNTDTKKRTFVEKDIYFAKGCYKTNFINTPATSSLSLDIQICFYPFIFQ